MTAHTQIDMNRLFILAEPRSGSSWLMETLRSHPDITMLPELYNDVQYSEVLGFKGLEEDRFAECIHYLEAFFVDTTRYTGCKILLNHLELISSEFPEYFMQHYRDAHFIFLCRRNLLHAHISLRIAHSCGIWHSKQNDPVKKRTVRIDPADLYAKIEKSVHRRASYVQLLENVQAKYFALTYEDLFAGPVRAVSSLLRFLDISDTRITFSTEKKGNPFALSTVIENFDEVKDFFQQHSEYYRMLLQPP
jgi:LPS sulfotransferase NodH